MNRDQASSSSEAQPERIELRSAGGPLLGVLLLSPLRLEVKRGKRVFEVDLVETMLAKEAVVVERSHRRGLRNAG